MQIGGVGSGHDTYSHQVTGCIHEHGENKDVGNAGAKLGSVQTIQTAEEVLQENSSVNLMSWVQNISSKGKQLLQKIWGEGKETNDAITSQNGNGNHIAGQETLVTGNSVGVKTTMNRAVVETAATHTYFRPVEAKDTMPANPFQKVRYQVLSGNVKPWMYSRATSSGKTVCGTPARLPPGLFSAQDQIQDRCRLRCPRRKYVTGSPPCCEGARSAPRVLPHRKRP